MYVQCVMQYIFLAAIVSSLLLETTINLIVCGAIEKSVGGEGGGERRWCLPLPRLFSCSHSNE